MAGGLAMCRVILSAFARKYNQVQMPRTQKCNLLSSGGGSSAYDDDYNDIQLHLKYNDTKSYGFQSLHSKILH